MCGGINFLGSHWIVYKNTAFFDESTGKWTEGPNLNHGRFGHDGQFFVTNGGGFIVIYGGISASYEDIYPTEILDLKLNQWKVYGMFPFWL